MQGASLHMISPDLDYGFSFGMMHHILFSLKLLEVLSKSFSSVQRLNKYCGRAVSSRSKDDHHEISSPGSVSGLSQVRAESEFTSRFAFFTWAEGLFAQLKHYI
ncbi:hypothetical protein LIER_22668 [Lithospermum erythrorhizon]|uniref:Uncharacterized protein n=1 Tax=Lithospermum erythrorhizon TaxID=34254 RepID=A0AAV3QW98_LITER